MHIGRTQDPQDATAGGRKFFLLGGEDGIHPVREHIDKREREHAKTLSP